MRLTCGTWITLALFATSMAVAEPRPSAEPSIEMANLGDRVILRWGELPVEAVEQEILMSIDGGKHWVEIARPATIDVREWELRLPSGVDAEIRFAIRAGNELEELGEAATPSIELTERRDSKDPTAVIAGWQSGVPRQADPGQGHDLPLLVEPNRDEGQERFDKRPGQIRGARYFASADPKDTRSRLSIPEVNPRLSPLEFPLLN